MADDRVSFPEEVPDDNKNAATAEVAETAEVNTAAVEEPIEVKKSFVAFNMIQTPYNCKTDQSMDSSGVCREPF